MTASNIEWTWAGAHAPWLRGQNVHVAQAGLEPAVAKALTGAGYVYAHASSVGVTAANRYSSLAGALKLRESAANNLDALRDALSDLPQHWPGRHRLVMLWTSPDELMHVDMLGFLHVVRVLADATDDLWADSQFVFETVLFVPSPFAADHP